MRTPIGLLFLLICANQTRAATLLTFYGQDNLSGPIVPGPNSTAARNSFLAAAGAVRLIDFEAESVRSFGPGEVLSLTGGVTIEATEDANGAIGNDGAFNTTPGGQNYLGIGMVDNSNGDETGRLTFHFPQPIFGFGAFFTDLNQIVAENPHTFNFLFLLHGVPQVVNLTNAPAPAPAPLDSVALVFFGFVVPGAAISSLTLEVEGTLILDSAFSIDDIYYSSIPEPGTALLVGFSAILVAGIRRRSRRAEN